MSFETNENLSVQVCDPVPNDARVLLKTDVFEGAGGRWRIGVWVVGLKRLRAVLIPEERGAAMALSTVWSNMREATSAAAHFAEVAAQVQRRGVYH